MRTLVIFLALTLFACGGSSGDDPDSGSNVDSSVSNDVNNADSAAGDGSVIDVVIIDHILPDVFRPDSGMCGLTPRSGPGDCCFDDFDCVGTRGATCRNSTMCTAGNEGICKLASGPGKCWTSDDCNSGETCMGASICACGLACFGPDIEGTCTGST